ncbi:MAG TPA: hypothetical protein VM580_14640 [Labilithrix sp.]|nr:hypothetical protein [Labilithrix sp.]
MNVVRIGQHEIRYEPDTGFVYIVNDGVLTADEARVLTSTLFEFAGRSGRGEPAFIIADGRKSTGLTTEARQVISSTPGADGAYVATFGASLPVRVLANLVMKAVALTRRVNTVMHFVADETEARAWVAEAQRAHRARGAIRSPSVE